MRDVQYPYRVKQEVVTQVWAPNSDGAIARSTRAIMGPSWRHRWPWKFLPWRHRPVASVGTFHAERLRGAR